jgi:molecular chaperone DnaK
LSKIIGIDFGTSKSAAAIAGNGKITIIPDLYDRGSLPSLVMIAPEGRLYVGWDAKKHPSRYERQYRTVNSAKRLIEKAGTTNWGDLQIWPQEISALILGYLRVQAEIFCDDKVERAVIAVPSHFDLNQRLAIKQIAMIAGLSADRLVSEATSAAFAYRGVYPEQDRTALVFDFGGGKLDISIVRSGEGFVEVIASIGDDRLGGDDFDQVIIDFLIDRISRDIGLSTELGPLQHLYLREIASQAKIDLSNMLEARMYVPGFLSTANRKYSLDVVLSRSDFEGLSKPLFDRAESLLQQGIEIAYIRPSDIQDLLLIGGTSHIPCVRDLVCRRMGREPSGGFDPMLIVAQGAALLGGVLSGNVRDNLLLDVTSSSYSAARPEDSEVTRMITRNTCLPTWKSETFTTTRDNQTSLNIRIYQGEQTLASDNTFLGEIQVKGIPPAQAGNPKIEVVFDIDANHVLHVRAREKLMDRIFSTTLMGRYGLDDMQVRSMSRRVDEELVKLRQVYDSALKIKRGAA